MENELACLGVKWLGKCSYMMTNPQRVYFGIGHIMPALLLLLIFTQIITPNSKFRLNTKAFNYKKAVRTYLASVACVFVAAIVTLLPYPRIPVLGYSIVWEILGGVLFVVATIRLMFTIYKPVLFNRDNFKSYVRGCVEILESEQEGRFQFLAEEFAHSVPDVIAAIKEHSKLRSKEAHKNKYGKYAALLLNLLANEKFCKHMVCHAPSTAVKILESIVANKLYHEGGETIVGSILTQAFIEKNSVLQTDFLAKRMEFMGFSSRGKFFRYAFRNQDFLESHFEPLRVWQHERDNNIKSWKIKRYFSILRAAQETYFDSKQYNTFCGYLQTGFNLLTDLAKEQAIVIQSTSKAEIAQSTTYQNLREIAHGYLGLMTVIGVYYEKLPEYSFDPKRYLVTSDPSIYNLVANAIFEYLCDLSLVLDNDEAMRKLAMILWEPLFISSAHHESKVIDEIKKRLTVRILRRVRRDMRVDYPPYLLRIILNIVGLCPEEKDSFKKQLHGVVAENFVKRVSHRDEIWLKHLLPQRMHYDEEQKLIIETVSEERTHQLKVN